MGLVAAGTTAWLLGRTDRNQTAAKPTPTNSTASLVVAANSPQTGGPSPAAATSVRVTSTRSLPVKTFPWFQTHPFKVAKSSEAFGWTAEDGKDTNVIRLLAHNELEYQRMANENSTIYRRQLVYHPDGFTLQSQQAMQSGQSIQQLTLPSLDGQELPVTVTKTDFESGGDKGIFYGKLAGDPDSMVTVAFINGWESFTVISRQNQIFLHAEARGPGELVVKQINPDTYGTGLCGNQ